ncbi:unnamed protein product [Camellia sinensis]
MADLEHSTCDHVSSVDSRAEDTSQDSKPKFSEDEETLITRMYNLVGESRGLSLLEEFQEELRRKLRSIGLQDIPQPINETPQNLWCDSSRARKFWSVVQCLIE